MLVQHEISGLDIAVHNTNAVCMFKRKGSLHPQPCDVSAEIGRGLTVLHLPTEGLSEGRELGIAGGRRWVWLAQTQLTSGGNERGQRLPVDELHDEIMNACFKPHGVDRHDMRVMKLSGRLHLDLKPLHLPGVQGRVH